MIDLYIIDINKFNNEKLLSDVLNNASLFRLNKYYFYKNDLSKKQSIAVTYLLNIALKKYGLVEKNIIYLENEFKKPYFRDYKDLHFSISHSGNLGMLVMSDEDIGCDIQIVEKIDEGIYKFVLSKSEQDIIISESNSSKKEDIFFKYWVMKEAIVKKKGDGFKNDLTKINDSNIYINFIIFEEQKYYYSIYNGNIINEYDISKKILI